MQQSLRLFCLHWFEAILFADRHLIEAIHSVKMKGAAYILCRNVTVPIRALGIMRLHCEVEMRGLASHRPYLIPVHCLHFLCLDRMGKLSQNKTTIEQNRDLVQMNMASQGGPGYSTGKRGWMA